VAGVGESGGEEKSRHLSIDAMYQSYFKIIFDFHMLSAYKTEVIENIYDKSPIMIP
jgi:hypothetical protein